MLVRTTGLIIIVASIWWWGVFLAMHALQPDVSPVTAPGSAYVRGEYAPLATTVYWALSAALLSAGLGLAKTLPATRRTRVATIAFAVAGLATILAGVFPMDFPGPLRTRSGYLHAIGGIIGFSSWMLGTLLFSISIRRDSRWARRSRTLFSLSLLSLMVFAVLLSSVIVLGFGGYAQRVLVAVLFTWLIIAARHLVRLSTSHDGPRPEPLQPPSGHVTKRV